MSCSTNCRDHTLSSPGTRRRHRADVLFTRIQQEANTSLFRPMQVCWPVRLIKQCDLSIQLIFLANRHILWASNLYYGATYSPENTVFVDGKLGFIVCVGFMEDISVHSTLNFNDLPIEILRHIVSFFTQKELLLTVAPVCQLWHELAYDPICWRTLSFDLSNENITSATLHSCFARSHLLRSLEIIGGRYSRFLLSAADIRCCASCCDKVVHLELRFISSLDLEMIDDVVHSFPRLETLNVEGCEQLDHKCVLRICDLSHLWKLNIAHCTQLSDKMLDIISCNLPQLQALNIDGLNQISDRYVFISYLIDILLSTDKYAVCLA